MRCDVGGASGHVTTKPSICNGSAFYKSSVCAANVSCLTPGDLSRVEGATEPRATEADRAAEVSRGHSRRVKPIRSSGTLTRKGRNSRGSQDRSDVSKA